MKILFGGAAARRVRKLADRGLQLSKFEPQVQRIVRDVRRNGDQALRRYSERWDGIVSSSPLRVSSSEIRAAWKSATPELKKSLQTAAANIRQFCEWQKPSEWTKERGNVSLGQIVRPIESVGCYVPGGRYPLVSTLLMTVIPAQVAGVPNIRVASPRAKSETLAAAAMLGIEEIYRVGGAQAVAALAYGTETIPRVDKIVGPGNVYVTVAKKLVAFDCAIDFLAGPTEVVIVSQGGRGDFIAADLVAQAEHDPDALAVLITTRRSLATSVARAVKQLAAGNPTARQALQDNGVILLAKSRRQTLDWANQLAPEHITVSARDLKSIHNAGSIFVGEYSPQAAGDYASGPNHVLPTGAGARFRGGLNVLDFVKLISVQKLSKLGLRQIAPAVEILSQTEGLAAHAQSIRVRCAHA